MDAQAILKELSSLGKESYKRMLMNNHGVREPFFGVPIGELKKIQKRIKKDYQLALDLYDTGNYDAMYLAGMIADDERMTRKDLQQWVERAYGGALAGATVPGVAAGSPNGWEMARKWIESEKAMNAAAGWATLSAIVSVKPDAELDIAELKRLMKRVEKEIQSAPDLVRYQMNGFLIAAGCYVASLSEMALQIGKKIGPVHAHLGNNDCAIPYGPDYIRKVEARGTIGKKRKHAKC